MISLGERLSISSTITPSTTYNGSTPPSSKVEAPRTRIDLDSPGAPDVAVIETPGAAPCKASNTLTALRSSIALASTEVIDPALSLFFIVPKPTIITSSSILESSFKITLILLDTTLIS